MQTAAQAMPAMLAALGQQNPDPGDADIE